MTDIVKEIETPTEPILTLAEKKRIYQREYMRKRREADPEFAQKQRDYVNKNKNTRYANDEQYRLKKKEQVLSLYRKYRDAYKQLNEAPK